MTRRGEPGDMSAGVAKYVEFHQLDPKQVGPFALARLPARVHYVGQMKWTSYASNKWGDKNCHYIHEHDAGVKLYMPHRPSGVVERPIPNPGGAGVTVPQWIARVNTFVKLGRCLGLGYQNLNDEFEAQGDAGSELFCTPNGKALLVIQDRKRLEAIIWGGKLDVQAVGIVH